MPEESGPRLLVSGQGEGVGQQGHRVQVVHLAAGRLSEAAQAPVHHWVLVHPERGEREERVQRGAS